MAAGCIPVIVVDHYVLPFEDVIDWQKAAVRLYEGRLDLASKYTILTASSHA